LWGAILEKKLPINDTKIPYYVSYYGTKTEDKDRKASTNPPHYVSNYEKKKKRKRARFWSQRKALSYSPQGGQEIISTP